MLCSKASVPYTRGRHHSAGCVPTHTPCWFAQGRPSPAAQTRVAQQEVAVLQADSTAAQQLEAAGAANAVSACPVLSQLRQLPPPRLGRLESIWLTLTNPDEAVRRGLGGQEVASNYFVGLPVVTIAGMEPLKSLMAAEAAGSVVSGYPASFRLLLGEDSITMTQDVELHHFLRKLMSPAFTSSAMDAYLDEIQALCRETLEEWVDECGKGHTVLALAGLQDFTMRVIASVVMNIELRGQQLREFRQDFTLWTSQLTSFLPYDVWPLPFWTAMRAKDRLYERLGARVDEVIKQLEAGGGSSRAAESQLRSPSPGAGHQAAQATQKGMTLKRLLLERDENGKGLTRHQVVISLMGLLFAGHDTSAAHLTCVLNDLATRPQVLARVRAEQQAIIQRHGPRMTPAALRDMKYTQAVLSECMRIQPIVAGAMRQAQADVDVGGYLVPQGTVMNPALGNMMKKDPRWPAEGDPATNPLHPANFNPDRFMSEEGAKQGWQLPFGYGVHTCLGQPLVVVETKIFLATLARGYSFVADTNTGWVKLPMPRPLNNLPTYVTRHSG